MPATRVIHRSEAGAYAPAECVFIGRPSKWGNPFKIGRDGTRAEVIAKYRLHVMGTADLLTHVHELRGKVLVCFCKPLACHGDVLAELAERYRP